ncbi:hypothetical protein [Sinimarinibacterium flocculans]|uniref:hypothetical protein n=1 Tax=Sinimarinibacterium flocculans TaxID=985250 RepID=UPI0024936FA6|nr:hypothetical protein [Sinimarinibacterium flocculans]
MSSIDVRSPETAYSSKPNTEFPGSAAQKLAAESAAAARKTDKVNPNDPTTLSATGAVVTETVNIKPTPDLIPAHPVITTPVDEDTTTDTTPTVAGTAPAGSTVNVYLDGVLEEEDLTVTDGDWTVDLSAQSVDVYVITATATIDGYESPHSWPVELSILPAAPAITVPTDEASITDTTPDVEGTTGVGTLVDLYIDDVLTEEDIAETAGAWTVTLDELALDTYVLTAIAKENGLSSAVSDPIEFTITE